MFAFYSLSLFAFSKSEIKRKMFAFSKKRIKAKNVRFLKFSPAGGESEANSLRFASLSLFLQKAKFAWRIYMPDQDLPGDLPVLLPAAGECLRH